MLYAFYTYTELSLLCVVNLLIHRSASIHVWMSYKLSFLGCWVLKWLMFKFLKGGWGMGNMETLLRFGFFMLFKKLLWKSRTCWKVSSSCLKVYHLGLLLGGIVQFHWQHSGPGHRWMSWWRRAAVTWADTVTEINCYETLVWIGRQWECQGCSTGKAVLGFLKGWVDMCMGMICFSSNECFHGDTEEGMAFCGLSLLLGPLSVALFLSVGSTAQFWQCM